MTYLLSTDAIKGRKGEDLHALPVFAGSFSLEILLHNV